MDIVKENLQLKKKISIYEVSTKLDYEKIERLQAQIKELKQELDIIKKENKINI